MLGQNISHPVIFQIKIDPSKDMKIADAVLLSLFMTNNVKYNISNNPSTGLSGTEIIAVIDPEGPKKYNTKMKYCHNGCIYKLFQYMYYSTQELYL